LVSRFTARVIRTFHLEPVGRAARAVRRVFTLAHNMPSSPSLPGVAKKVTRSNAQCEQFNHADPDHQHGECYRVIVEPISPLVHHAPPFPVSLHLAGRRGTRFSILNKRLTGVSTKPNPATEPQAFNCFVLMIFVAGH